MTTSNENHQLDADDELIEHPFAQFVRTIGRGKRSRRDFTRAEAAASMRAILDGQASDAQIGAWLMLLRVKEETPEELAGFVDACRAWIMNAHGALPAVDIDWPSYAGKKKHSPWYLLSALALAQSGIRILMHGGPAHTPARLYSDQALSSLGIQPAHSFADVAQQLDQSQFSYVDLNLLCAPLSPLLELRYQLGLRSPINTLARCLNPANAPLSLQSVFHPAYISLQQGAAQLLDEPNLLIFKGEGGEIEIRPDAETRLHGLRQGEPFEQVWPSSMPRHTTTGFPDAQQVRAVWRAEITDEYGEQAVLQTMAVILWELRKAATLVDAQRLAQRLWDQRDRHRV